MLSLRASCDTLLTSNLFFLPSSLFLLSVRGLDEDVIEYETDLLPVRSDWRIEHDVVGRPSHDPL